MSRGARVAIPHSGAAALGRADEALYRAKHADRNKVIVSI
jgi:PleD family two-component response regulator